MNTPNILTISVGNSCTTPDLPEQLIADVNECLGAMFLGHSDEVDLDFVASTVVLPNELVQFVSIQGINILNAHSFEGRVFLTFQTRAIIRRGKPGETRLVLECDNYVAAQGFEYVRFIFGDEPFNEVVPPVVYPGGTGHKREPREEQ